MTEEPGAAGRAGFLEREGIRRFTRPLAVVADVTAVVSVAFGVRAYLLGKDGVALVLGGCVLLAGVLTVLLLAPPGRKAFSVLAAVAAAAGSAVVLHWWSSPPPAGRAADRVVLTFDAQPDTVPFCRSYSGRGEISEGQALLIFDRATGDPGSDFWFHAPAERTPGGWTIRDVSLGEPPAASLRILLDRCPDPRPAYPAPDRQTAPPFGHRLRSLQVTF